MFSKGCIINDLGAEEVAVWSKLSPGISPSEWAGLCRQIGNLTPGAFSTLVAIVNAHQSLKNAVKRQVSIVNREAYEPKESINWEDTNRHLKSKGVMLLSAGLDEVPWAYKDIEKVMEEQADLVETVARFNPKIVKMAGENERPED